MTPAKHDKNRANAIDEVESGRALKLVYREMVEPPLIAISFSVAIVLVILFGVSGPRSTAATLNLLERIGYFGTIAGLCWPFCHALAALVLYFVRLRPPLLMVPATVAAGLFAATNVATVAYALYRLFVPDHPGDLRWSVMYLVAAVVTIPYVALIYFLACQRARLRPVVEWSGAADPIVPAPGSAPRSGAETGRRPREMRKAVSRYIPSAGRCPSKEVPRCRSRHPHPNRGQNCARACSTVCPRSWAATSCISK